MMMMTLQAPRAAAHGSLPCVHCYITHCLNNSRLRQQPGSLLGPAGYSIAQRAAAALTHAWAGAIYCACGAVLVLASHVCCATIRFAQHIDLCMYSNCHRFSVSVTAQALADLYALVCTLLQLHYACERSSCKALHCTNSLMRACEGTQGASAHCAAWQAAALTVDCLSSAG